MSRNVIVGIAVLVVVILAWIVIGRMGDGDDVVDAPVEAPLVTDEEVVDGDVDVVVEPDTAIENELEESEAEIETLADEAVVETEEALEETGEAVEGAADATVDAADDAADATVEAVDDAAESVDEATDGVEVEAVDGEVDGAEAEVTTSVVPITPVEGDTAVEGDATVEADAELETLLNAETFDAEAWLVYVDESDLNALTKTTLRTTIEQARDNPDMVPGALEQLRARLQAE